MNIFLPYEDNIVKSVRCLDNKRLVKQIIECKSLLDNAVAFCSDQGKSNRYSHHPVSIFYQDNPNFIAYYGLMCCEEYEWRFGKWHNLHKVFGDYFMPLVKLEGFDLDKQPQYIPYYMEGSANKPESVRTPSSVSALFQAKLIGKWIADKTKPKWGKRQTPIFFEEYLKLNKEQQCDFWKQVEEIKEQVRTQKTMLQS